MENSPRPRLIHGSSVCCQSLCLQAGSVRALHSLFHVLITAPISIIFHIPLSDPAINVSNMLRSVPKPEPDLLFTVWAAHAQYGRLWKVSKNSWIKNELNLYGLFIVPNPPLRSKSSSHIYPIPAVLCWQVQAGHIIWMLAHGPWLNKGCIQTVKCADAVETAVPNALRDPGLAGKKKGGCKEY